MKNYYHLLYCCAVVSTLSLTACVKTPDIYQGEDDKEIKKEDFFDFVTTSTNRLSLQYGIPVEMSFYLYDEYPYELVENTWEKKDIDAIYAGSTDKQGAFSTDIVLPEFIKKVWLVTDNVFVASPIEIELTATGEILYTKVEGQRSVNARADMGNGVSVLDGYDRLGKWDTNGQPDYLLSTQVEIPSGFLKRCNSMAKTTEGSDLLKRYPELVSTGTNDMVLTKSTELVATYFKSSAGFCNMVAYYTYREGETIDINTVKKTILFPLYTGGSTTGANPFLSTTFLAGKQVKMRYWNETTQSYQDEFPAGTRIGWVMPVYYGKDNWQSGKSPDKLRYSNPVYNESLNGVKQQRSVLLADTELDNYFFMAMEDNNDMRFNDVQFAITSSTSSSVVPPPTIPDEVGRDEVLYSVRGSLAFEDSWPKIGDYDMNDVVVNFKGNIVKKSNRVVRVTTTFTAVNNGATYTNGFGFQLDKLLRGDNRVQKSGVSVTRDGQIYLDQFNAEYANATLLLFSNTRDVLNKPINVEIRFNEYGTEVNENDVRPPFNPFIYVNTPEHEVHLPGYLPTNKADDSLRGTENDLKEDKDKNAMYYISKDNMPFALYVSGRYFNYPDERQNILVKYPSFKDWRDSQGKYNQDWYVSE